MGARNRFFLEASQSCLRGDEAKHCARVFRHQVGDEIEVFSGDGGYSVARITAIGSGVVQIEKISDHHKEPPTNITIAPALLKGKAFETIIRKACEVGARQIIPLQVEHCVVRIKPDEFAKKREKWERIAIEAAKQCGITHLPKIWEPQSLEEFVERDESDLKLVAALLDDTRPLHKIVEGRSFDAATVAIGPEGDFQPEEVAFLAERGYQPLDLGPNVLRADTAAIHALSILSYEATR
ncbi:MAG: RsmE family RNA methyltransferase [Verrucomicrobiota bacterium]